MIWCHTRGPTHMPHRILCRIQLFKATRNAHCNMHIWNLLHIFICIANDKHIRSHPHENEKTCLYYGCRQPFNLTHYHCLSSKYYQWHLYATQHTIWSNTNTCNLNPMAHIDFYGHISNASVPLNRIRYIIFCSSWMLHSSCPLYANTNTHTQHLTGEWAGAARTNFSFVEKLTSHLHSWAGENDRARNFVFVTYFMGKTCDDGKEHFMLSTVYDQFSLYSVSVDSKKNNVSFGNEFIVPVHRRQSTRRFKCFTTLNALNEWIAAGIVNFFFIIAYGKITTHRNEYRQKWREYFMFCHTMYFCRRFANVYRFWVIVID